MRVRDPLLAYLWLAILFVDVDAFQSWSKTKCLRKLSSRPVMSSTNHHTSRDIYLGHVKNAIRNAILFGASATAAVASTSEVVPAATKPEITDLAYLNIKIANYTEESIGRNRGAQGSGRLIVGLYGKAAPLSVARFLATVDGDGESAPSYTNTLIPRVKDNLLEIDNIRGIEKATIAGTEQYDFRGTYLPDYKLILESNGISHDRRGLLSRVQLTAGPEFGITVGPAAQELDSFHVVFGEVVGGMEVLDAIAAIPTYQYKTKTGYASSEKGDNLADNLADSWFASQKSFYVAAGQMVGDRRAVDRRGKLLRRVLLLDSGRLPLSTLNGLKR